MLRRLLQLAGGRKVPGWWTRNVPSPSVPLLSASPLQSIDAVEEAVTRYKQAASQESDRLARDLVTHEVDKTIHAARMKEYAAAMEQFKRDNDAYRLYKQCTDEDAHDKARSEAKHVSILVGDRLPQPSAKVLKLLDELSVVYPTRPMMFATPVPPNDVGPPPARPTLRKVPAPSRTDFLAFLHSSYKQGKTFEQGWNAYRAIYPEVENDDRVTYFKFVLADKGIDAAFGYMDSLRGEALPRHPLMYSAFLAWSEPPLTVVQIKRVVDLLLDDDTVIPHEALLSQIVRTLYSWEQGVEDDWVAEVASMLLGAGLPGMDLLVLRAVLVRKGQTGLVPAMIRLHSELAKASPGDPSHFAKLTRDLFAMCPHHDLATSVMESIGNPRAYTSDFVGYFLTVLRGLERPVSGAAEAWQPLVERVLASSDVVVTADDYELLARLVVSSPPSPSTYAAVKRLFDKALGSGVPINRKFIELLASVTVHQAASERASMAALMRRHTDVGLLEPKAQVDLLECQLEPVAFDQPLADLACACSPDDRVRLLQLLASRGRRSPMATVRDVVLLWKSVPAMPKLNEKFLDHVLPFLEPARRHNYIDTVDDVDRSSARARFAGRIFERSQDGVDKVLASNLIVARGVGIDTGRPPASSLVDYFRTCTLDNVLAVLGNKALAERLGRTELRVARQRLKSAGPSMVLEAEAVATRLASTKGAPTATEHVLAPRPSAAPELDDEDWADLLNLL